MYPGPKHLWNRLGISLKWRGHFYCAAVWTALLFNCVTWGLCAKHVCWLEVDDNRCLRDTPRIRWSDRANNVRLRNGVLGIGFENILSPHQVQLCWLNLMMRAGNTHLPQCRLLDVPPWVEETTWMSKYDVAAWNEKIHSEFRQNKCLKCTRSGPKRRVNQPPEILQDVAANGE